MSTQSEHELEARLVSQLQSMGYEYVSISNEAELKANLKRQLEALNAISLSKTEFTQVLHHLHKGNIFEKAKILRDRCLIHRDDGTTVHIRFLNSEHWCKNLFQVSRQISVKGQYHNRYDVTLLINGFPLVQIELKRRGLEIKEAFQQVSRYQRYSYGSNTALFQYIQIFIISNGVNTKYYANNRDLNAKQTFFWAEKDNTTVSRLEDFTSIFLEKCHISKMICRYIVLSEAEEKILVLRPYQFYAVEEIVNTVQNTTNNGYIWHTTGSGKTLTSFKASQILTQDATIDKILFVVDRKDLDYQTSKEFNSFSEGSVDATEHTKHLIQQLQDNNKKLIITTIQKLNRAVEKHQAKLQNIKDKKIVCIFDECHRSQFGVTHKNITSFFPQHQLIGFTGTPIFEENAQKNDKTTASVFGKSLHRYTIVDAIRDGNVLRFSVEYVGRYKENEQSKNTIDISVEDIDTKEFLGSDKRIEKIVDYILTHHAQKTHTKQYTAILCVPSIEVLIRYYDIFKKKEHDLKIATVFSYSQNEEEMDAHTISDIASVRDDNQGTINSYARDALETCIQDYNKMFTTQYTAHNTDSFYDYYNNVSQRVRRKQIDILIVVNMFLTGFDSKFLNTLYVDKSLQYHGLIQAFSRTNRIHNEQKSHGNIVCFRNLKQKTDEAIALFSNKDAKDTILLQPYQNYVEQCKQAYDALIAIAPHVEDVDALTGEEETLAFIKAFRTLMRIINTLSGFSDFTWDDIPLSEQEFENYTSKYLDIHDKTKNNRSKESIIDDIDFELQLIQKDDITVDYILRLLTDLFNAPEDKQQSLKEKIYATIDANPQLRSKKQLIENFIERVSSQAHDINIEEAYNSFVEEEREKTLKRICEEYQLKPDTFWNMIDNYLYDNKEPLGTAIEAVFLKKYKLGERDEKIDAVREQFHEYTDIYHK